MCNLAVADLALVVSSIPFNFIEKLQQPEFPFGFLLCKLLWPFQTSTAMTAIFTVAMLSFQRYLMIVRPTEKYQKGSKVIILSTLAFLWISPILLAAVPFAFSLNLDADNVCDEVWSDQYKKYFTVYLTFVQYALPLGVIAWCNGRSVIELKRQEIYRENVAIINSSMRARHKSVVRMLICIVAAFAIFWFPGQLAWLVLTFSDGSEKWQTMLDISEIFTFTNSALNPLVFFAYNNEYSIPKCNVPWWIARRLDRRDTRSQRASSGTVQMLSSV